MTIETIDLRFISQDPNHALSISCIDAAQCGW